MGYLANFMVYTFAMVGVIVIALLVFKGANGGVANRKSKFLKVHDSLSLAPRKTLYIISAGEEKFLIAGDVDKTTLISKLDVKENKNFETSIKEDFEEIQKHTSIKTNYMDKGFVGINKTQTKPYNSVIKNLAEQIKL